MGKRNKEDDTFPRKKQKKKQSVTIMASVDQKGPALPVKLKLEGKLKLVWNWSLNKDIKKENFKKDLMNLTETYYQTSEHSVSSNK